MTGVLIRGRRERVDIHRHRGGNPRGKAHEDGGREGRDTSTNQGTSGISGHIGCQQTGMTLSLSESLQKEIITDNLLISDVCGLYNRESTGFGSFMPPVGGNLSRQPQESKKATIHVSISFQGLDLLQSSYCSFHISQRSNREFLVTDFPINSNKEAKSGRTPEEKCQRCKNVRLWENDFAF